MAKTNPEMIAIEHNKLKIYRAFEAKSRWPDLIELPSPRLGSGQPIVLIQATAQDTALQLNHYSIQA